MKRCILVDFLVALSKQDLIDITHFLYTHINNQVEIDYNEKLNALYLRTENVPFIKFLNDDQEIVQISNNKEKIDATILYSGLHEELFELISGERII